jgi:hypothetical protein
MEGGVALQLDVYLVDFIMLEPLDSLAVFVVDTR